MEELIRRDLALVGDDGRVQRQHSRRIIRCRIVIGNRAANGAAVANGRIADTTGECGERRNGLANDSRGSDIGVAGHGADNDVATLHFDARQTVSLAKIDKGGWRSKALLHGWKQSLAAGQHLGVWIFAKEGRRLTNRFR